MLSNPTRGALGFTLALMISLPAAAGGFQVQQQGAKASGRGGAFVSQADDASATYYNPAAAAKFDGWKIYLGGGVNSFGDTTFVGTDGVSTPMQDVDNYLGSFYVTGPLGDHYAIALGAWSPFSLSTRWWDTDPTAQSALDTHWTTTELNANIIAKLNNEWSIALGIEQVSLKVEQFSSAYDMSRLEPFLFPAPEPLNANRNFALSGDKAGVNLAIHYQGEGGANFGLSFRSKKVVHTDGRLYWQDVSQATFLTGTQLVDPSGCAFNPQFCPMGAVFTDSTAEATFVLPWTVQLGFGKKGQKWDWEVDLLITAWEDFDSVDIDVTGRNGVVSGFSVVETTDDFQQTERWTNSFSLFTGADYHINDSNTFRFGFALDQSPVDEELTRPYNPDSDKIGVTAGYGWNSSGGHVQVDLYGQYWSYMDATAEDFPNERVVPGTYETSVISLGASFQYTF